jgi:hypothetical protein
MMNMGFTSDHSFRAGSLTALLGAYFDPDHLAMLDAATGVGERVACESIDDGTTRACTWQLTALQPLPWFVRPLVPGGRLTYLETARWRRGDHSVALSNVCELLGGRVAIDAAYEFETIDAGSIRQRFTATARSDIKIVGKLIVRTTVDQLASAMPAMNECTQRWLDRQRAG